MAQIEDLMRLMTEFSDAFADPEAAQPGAKLAKDSTTDRTQQLLELIEEFPQAFADPEALQNQQEVATAEPEATSAPVASQTAPNPSVPAGYTPALRRRVQTMGWGAIDFTLTYGEQGLTELWITVGKSGTEVQSLCEAIARLINLLLAHRVPTPDIVREIRGIRGADSEGLGPHRFLGLADLIGKVLQEAPSAWRTSGITEPVPVPEVVRPESERTAPETVGINGGLTSNLIPGWGADGLEPVGGHQASLCPDCGAELQQPV
jgi:hypothetical protein